MAIVHGNFPDSNTMMSAVQRTLVEYVDGAKAHIEEILAKEKAKINRTANREFRRLRKAHEDKLKATHERDVFAAANIEPSFGPSLRNAEVEIRNRLGGVTIEEGLRENIIGMFKGILYSFTYAISVEESGPGGCNTRYLSVIDGQNHLIESLRLLHKHRENAYAENEELVKMLCLYNKNKELAIPRKLQDVYSPKDDKFILSPLNGPTALSMKVSVSAPPFQGRPDADLELDPHWQRFLDSIARKEAEQDARHTSAVRGPFGEKAEVRSGIEDAGVQEYNDTSRIDDGGSPNGEEVKEKMGIKDSSEQNHRDTSKIGDGREDGDHGNENEIREVAGVNTASEKTHYGTPRDDETIPSAVVPDGLSEDDLESNPEGDNDIISAIHADAESSQKECGGQKGESFLHHKRLSKLIISSGPMDHSLNRQIGTAKDTLSWVQWQIRYLRLGHGTPEDPDAKLFSDVPRATTIEETGDAALARKLQEAELAIWRRDKIESYEKQVERLSASIVSLEAARGLSKTAKRALERKTAKNKTKEAGEVGVPKPKPKQKPKPKKAEDPEARQ